MREAEAAFGDPTVFLEQAVMRPAPHRGADPRRRAAATWCTCSSATARCSAATRRSSRSRRRRTSTRRCATGSAPDAVAFARQIGYVNAGTVEFLLDTAGARRPARVHRDEPAHPGRAHGHRGDHRRRPGAVADADRGGGDPGRPRAAARTTIAAARRRAAVPHHHRGPGERLPPRHRPHHRPTARRAARASASTAAPRHAGSQISPHFDSMLVKLTCRGRDFPTAVAPGAARARRVPHPRRLAPTSRSCRPCSTTRTSSPGDVTTSFIDERPQLLTRARPGGPRHQDAAATWPTSRSTSRTATRPPTCRPARQAARRST